MSCYHHLHAQICSYLSVSLAAVSLAAVRWCHFAELKPMTLHHVYLPTLSLVSACNLLVLDFGILLAVFSLGLLLLLCLCFIRVPQFDKHPPLKILNSSFWKPPVIYSLRLESQLIFIYRCRVNVLLTRSHLFYKGPLNRRKVELL